MKAIIYPSQVGGEIDAIASKSHAHRLLICAALSEEESEIFCRETNDDILATVSCLNALGANITRNGAVFNVIPIKTPPKCADIDCRESGSTLRFLLPVICALGIDCRIFMSGRLPKRPLSPLYEELISHGAILSAQGVSPLRISGSLRGTEYGIAGNVSSQFISGLLLALCVHGGGLINITSELESASYVDITLHCLEAAGIEVERTHRRIRVSGKLSMHGKYIVEGDWSNAAFWLCSGVLGKIPVTVKGLGLNSAQGDRRIIGVLRDFGAKLDVSDTGITVFPSPLRAADIDAAGIPDLVPVLSLLCAAANGESRIYNAARLRLKESDRLASVTATLSAMGADICESADGLVIRGGKKLRGAAVGSFGDHRIAMTAAIASVLCDGVVEIDGAEAVNKSYPRFFDDFAALGGRLELI